MVSYDPRFDQSARTVAAAIPGSKLVSVKGLGRTIQVTVGTSYTGARKVGDLVRQAHHDVAGPGAHGRRRPLRLSRTGTGRSGRAAQSSGSAAASASCHGRIGPSPANAQRS